MNSSDFPNLFSRFQKNFINLSSNTIKSYQRDLLQFVNFLDSVDVSVWAGVDSNTARTYLSHRRKEGDKATTIARKLSTLRKFFFWLVSPPPLRRSILPTNMKNCCILTHKWE